MTSEEPVAAVRAFFAAWEANEDPAPLATGPLAELMALDEAVEAGDLLRREVELRDATLAEAAGREALVHVDGSLRTTVQDPYSGAIAVREESLAGPAKAVEAGGVWRVADYTLGRRRVLAGFSREVEGAGFAGGLRATPVGCRLAHSSTWLYVEIENARGEVVRLRRANLHLHRLMPKRRGRVFGPPTIGRGETRLVVCEWRLALRQARGAVRLLAYGGAEQERIEVRFGVRAAAPAPGYLEPLRLGGEPRPPG